jgi:ABC-type bacteriocin/lantibiotic exporter with double-glycine peptidase domain
MIQAIFRRFSCDLTIYFSVALGALYSLLGWPIFAGVSATIIFIPLNLIFVRKTERWTEDLMKTKDERVRLLSENLQAMKTVKFFAWEKSVEEKVTEIRDIEVKQLRKVR